MNDHFESPNSTLNLRPSVTHASREKRTLLWGPLIRRRVLMLLFAAALIHLGCFLAVYLPYALHGYTDFTIFYTAGKIVTSGQSQNLYDPQLQWAIQQECCSVPTRQAALLFNHAPYEALLFAPLALLPYRVAYFAWACVNFGVLLLIGYLLREYLAPLLSRWWLLPIAAFGCVPVFMALVQGQDSLMLALFYTLAFVCLKRGSLFLGGACIALAAAKPQLVLPFVLILILRREWKPVLGLVPFGAALAVLPLTLMGRAATIGYIDFLVRFSKAPFDTSAAPPFNMPNLRGLVFTALDFSAAAPLQLAVIAALSVGVVWWAARFKGASPEETFAMAVVATLLASYHLYSHDATLWLVAVIVVAHRLRAERGVNALLAAATLPWMLLPAFLYLMAHRLFCLYAFSIIAFGLALWINAKTETKRESRGAVHVAATM